METILSGLIAAAAAIIVACINNNATRKLLEYKLTELQREVEKHNSVVERVYALEKEVDIIKATHSADDAK